MATIDVSHPYFINSGDHPGLLIVSVPLIGDANYHSWSRSMKMPFSPKTKLAATDPLYAAWRRANVLVLGWIHKAVSPDIAQSILWLDSVREVWLDLEERFSLSNLVRIFLSS
ncbi:hypothetical protein LINPERHAP1_LOCUS28527 [Linum perenne]